MDELQVPSLDDLVYKRPGYVVDVAGRVGTIDLDKDDGFEAYEELRNKYSKENLRGVPEIADLVATEKYVRIGEPDSDWMLSIYLDDDGRFAIEHVRHDDRFQDHLNRVADEYSIEAALDKVRSSPMRYATKPYESRWEEINDFLLAGEEAYFDVFSMRDDAVNSRALEIAEELQKRGYKPDGDFDVEMEGLEIVNDFEQAQSEGFPNTLALHEFDRRDFDDVLHQAMELRKMEQQERRLRRALKARLGA